MNYRLFQYTLPAPADLDDLNAFLRTQRVAAVTHHMVPTAGGTMLVFVVETVSSNPPRETGPTQPKVDYREQLSTEQFSVFSRLRDERKRWAEAEGVPVYTVFTNAQLAAMVRQRPQSPGELGKIEGIGPARVEKYGARLLELLGGAPEKGTT